MNIAKLENTIERFLRKLTSEKKSKHTILNYSSCLNSFLKYIRKNEYDLDFDFKQVVFDYIDDMDPDYSVNTLNTKRNILKSLIVYMSNRSYIDENFAGNIKLIRKHSQAKKHVLEPHEIQAMLDILEKDIEYASGYNLYHKVRNRFLFMMMIFTGMRRSEIVSLKWSDVNTRSNEITVLGKGSKERIIPLKKDIRYEYLDFKDLIEEFKSKGYNMDSSYIFRSEHKDKKSGEKNTHMHPKNVENIINSIVKRAGIEKKITPHNLRHNFASYALKSGMSIPSLSAILGHSSPDITMKIYAHEISMDERKKEMKKLDFGI